MTIDRTTIDPDRTYRVDLVRPVTVIGARFAPRGSVTMRGDLILLLIDQEGADVVRTAEPE